jgi:hypothetical protein
MIATQNNGLYQVTSPTSGKPKSFKRICGCIAWGDPGKTDALQRDHALVYGGETPAGNVIVFNEFQASLPDLIEEMIRLKDTLCCLTFWGSEEFGGHWLRLFDEDGLTRYQREPTEQTNIPRYKETEPLRRWPTFRDRNHVADIYEFHDEFQLDFEACRSDVERLVSDKRVATIKAATPTIEKLGGKSIADKSQLPVFRAYIGLVWHVWQTSELNAAEPIPTPKRWHWGG